MTYNTGADRGESPGKMKRWTNSYDRSGLMGTAKKHQIP